MTYTGLSMWNGSSKIHNFMDFGHSFCWRLWRPWMLISTKSKCHKSNFRISWMYRYLFYDLWVYFWCQITGLKYYKACLNTLYMVEYHIWWTTYCTDDKAFSYCHVHRYRIVFRFPLELKLCLTLNWLYTWAFLHKMSSPIEKKRFHFQNELQ